MGFLRETIRAYQKNDPAARSALEIFFLYNGLHATIYYRISHWLYCHHCRFLARWVSQHAKWVTGVEIHPAATIGRRLVIDHGTGIVVGATAEIGDDCLLYQCVTLGGTGISSGKRHPTLGNDVMVGSGAKILGPIRIGDHARVAAPKEKKPKVLLLPQASRCAAHAVSYLTGRGIDSDLIDFCIRTGRLYESSGRYHNVVFIGHDSDGKARYANLRGIGSDFKGECNGSDKRFSFNIPAENSGILHLFESAIDLLSFATIRKMNGINWKKDHLLSLAGVYQLKKETEQSSVPLALTQYLSDHPEIKTIVLRLDNDYAGRMAAKALMTVLPKEYTVSARFPLKGKDYNDYLCRTLRLPDAIRRQKETVR